MFASKDTLLTRPSGYQIQRSLRFRSSASASLTRTPASATNRKTWTWSGWVKRGALSSSQALFSCESAASNYSVLYFSSANILQFYSNSGGTDYSEETVAVFRDPSSWYHIVFALDTTQATASNRAKIYINGVQQTTGQAFGQIPQNNEPFINSLNQHAIGRDEDGNVNYFDGYATEVNFIDGQALTPSSFGAINAVTGVWSATKYAGTYGTNGFYLNFTDNSAATAATIGKDYSGNGNNWTPNNISVTAGATYDSMLDAPLGAGGGERGNYAVLNPIEAPSTSVVSNGNLQVVLAATSTSVTPSTLGVTNGKWYSEITFSATASGNAVAVGVGPAETYQPSIFSVGVNYFAFDGTKTVSGVNTSYGATWTTGDIIGIALDVDSGTITFYKNNTSQGAITLPASTSGWKICIQNGGGSSTKTMIANFGQRPFSYTPPTGFKALHTGNLAAPVIALPAQNMAATTYTGDGSSSRAISNAVNSVSFQPDWVWIKSRSNVRWHFLTDSVRGATKTIFSNDTSAEQTLTDALLSFNSGGFNIGSNTDVNANTNTFVAWQWKAGGTAVTNTAGSITSSVSANTTAGFSVVTYTGTGANATVGHGIGVAPQMVIVKRRNSTSDWVVYSSGLPSAAYRIWLNYDLAQDSGAAAAATWNSTAPTSTVFSVGTNTNSNASTDTYVAYCFAPVAGYSAFGSYTGNGSADGPFVYTGFRPRWVLIKGSSFGSNWFVIDTSRSSYNVSLDALRPNLSGAETSTGTYSIDILSNGFKLRTNAADPNTNAATFIYAAFAESPFKNSLAR